MVHRTSRILFVLLFAAIVSSSLHAQVPNQPPTCDVSVSPSSGAALSTTFSTNGSCNDQTGDIVSITINWGDGTIETFPFSPTGIVNITDSHSYRAPGTFQFTVSATDSANNTTTTRPQ